MGKCKGSFDIAHELPSACNDCRRRLKAEGIPITPNWLSRYARRRRALEEETLRVVEMRASETRARDAGMETSVM
jgi:hypothetical protein